MFCIAKAQRWLLREEGAAAEHDAHGPAPLCGQIGRNQPFDATVWSQGRVPRSKASQNIPEPCGVVYQKKRYHSNVLSTCYRFFPSFSQVLASHLHEVIHIVSLCDVNFQSQAFQTNGLDFVASVIHQGGNWHSTWLDGPARPHRAAFQLFDIVFGTSKGGPGFVGDINAIDRSGGFGEEKRRTGLAASQTQPFDESTISKSVLIRVILSRSGFKGFDSSGCSNPVQWGVRKITRLNSHVAKQHV